MLQFVSRHPWSLASIFFVSIALLASSYEFVIKNPEDKFGRETLVIQAQGHKTRVVDIQSKHRSPNHPKEYVMIGDSRYEVGTPWLGNRVGVDKDFGDRKLVMLPHEYGEEGREIYVTPETRDAFLKMAEAASKDGLSLKVDSGYRSSAYQEKIFLKKLAEGKTFEDISRWVAPPGYSEHILGTTLDLTPSNWTFNKTDAEKWLLENGEHFSFSQSYPKITNKGFAWEPWHWKFVGDS